MWVCPGFGIITYSIMAVIDARAEANQKDEHACQMTFLRRSKLVATCVKQPLKNRQTKILMKNGSLLKVESIAECST